MSSAQDTDAEDEATDVLDPKGCLEADVGITCYANSAPGFTGIMKHRYTDFLVNEVDLGGAVVRLTSLDMPPGERESNTGKRRRAAEQRQQAQQPASASAGPAAPAAAGAAREPTGSPPAVPGGDVADGVDGAVKADDERDEARCAAWVSESMAELGPALRQFSSLVPGEKVADQLRDWMHAVLEHRWYREGEPRGGRASRSGGAAGADRAAEGGSAFSERPTTVAEPEPLLLPADADKEVRTRLHRFFAAVMPPLPPLATETVVDKKAQRATGVRVSVRPRSGAAKRKREEGKPEEERSRWNHASRGYDGWPGGPDLPYCQFVMHKENADTQGAVLVLSRMLRCTMGAFDIAGTKDKRAVTCQRVTAHQITAARLAALNPRLRGIKLGNFEYVAEKLSLGRSLGNHFCITLRNAEGSSDADVEVAVAALWSSGLVNYFGLQRFGANSTPTHRVGAAVLKGEWKQAVQLIMHPSQGERPESAAARNIYLHTGDIKAALAAMPQHMSVERGVLGHLQRAAAPTDFVGALTSIPRNTRTLYVHAYQSYLWNLAASHRIARYGARRAVVGDLVLPPEVDAAPTQQDCSSRRLQTVHVVTQEEAEAGTYDITDVVLPLPGTQVKYPQHETAEVYARAAAADGVSLDEPVHRVREFSMAVLSGDYRRVLHRIRDLTWRLLRYDDPSEPLAATDLDVLEGKPAPTGNPSGAFLAVQLRFTLPPSGYATMVLRELMKATTATRHHQALTADHGLPSRSDLALPSPAEPGPPSPAAAAASEVLPCDLDTSAADRTCGADAAEATAGGHPAAAAAVAAGRKGQPGLVANGSCSSADLVSAAVAAADNAAGADRDDPALVLEPADAAHEQGVVVPADGFVGSGNRDAQEVAAREIREAIAAPSMLGDARGRPQP